MRTREHIAVIKENLSGWISDMKAGHGLLVWKKPRGGLEVGIVDLTRNKVLVRATGVEIGK